MRAGSLTGPRIVAAITQSDCGAAVGLLRGVALWAAGYCSCPCHAGVTECNSVECERVVVACVAWFDVDAAWAEFEVCEFIHLLAHLDRIVR